MKKNDKIYLIYILECISKIEKFITDGEDAFMKSELIQDAVLRNLHTLTESTQRISEVVKLEYTDVPWQDIAGFRNVLVHDYFMIDKKRIWKIIRDNIPILKIQV